MLKTGGKSAIWPNWCVLQTVYSSPIYTSILHAKTEKVLENHSWCLVKILFILNKNSEFIFNLKKIKCEGSRTLNVWFYGLIKNSSKKMIFFLTWRSCHTASTASFLWWKCGFKSFSSDGAITFESNKHMITHRFYSNIVRLLISTKWGQTRRGVILASKNLEGIIVAASATLKIEVV